MPPRAGPFAFFKSDRSRAEGLSQIFISGYLGRISSLLPVVPGGVITGVFAAPVEGGVITLLSPVEGGVITAGDCGAWAD
jgi:hypothetical protein